MGIEHYAAAVSQAASERRTKFNLNHNVMGKKSVTDLIFLKIQFNFNHFAHCCNNSSCSLTKKFAIHQSNFLNSKHANS